MSQPAARSITHAIHRVEHVEIIAPQAAESVRFDIQRLGPGLQYLIAWSEIRRANRRPRVLPSVERAAIH